MYFKSLLILVLLLAQLALILTVNAGNLPKTKDLKKTTNTKSNKLDTEKKNDKKSAGTDLEKDKTNEDDVVETANSEEKEEVDPSQIYKLVGIYLLNNQPKALIKNSSVPEEGTMEYQIGDYLDELQTLSISKISFNPTVRIELIDQNGLSYLIKPSGSDSKVSTPGKSSYGNKALPTHFSVGSSKSKSRKNSESTTSRSEKVETTANQDKKEEQVKAQAETVVKKEDSDATAKATPQGSTTQQSSTSTSLQATSQGASGTTQPSDSKAVAPAPTSKPQDGLDVSRPADPFAQK